MQPGPVLAPRILSQEGAASHLRLELAPGADLVDGLRDALLARGVTQAAIALIGGTLDAAQYLTGQPDASGERVAVYGAPTALAGPVTLVSGNAFLGAGADGSPLVHCHAVMAAADGRLHGGHIPPGTCPVVDAVAHVTVLRGAGFAVRDDAETGYPVFHPVAP